MEVVCCFEYDENMSIDGEEKRPRVIKTIIGDDSVDKDQLLLSDKNDDDQFDWRKVLRDSQGQNDNGESENVWHKLVDIDLKKTEKDEKKISVLDKIVAVSGVEEIDKKGLFGKYVVEVWNRREENSFLDIDRYICIQVESLGYFKSDGDSDRVQTFTPVTQEYIKEKGLDPEIDILLRVDNLLFNEDKKDKKEVKTSFFVLTRNDMDILWARSVNEPECLLEFLEDQGVNTKDNNFLTGEAVRMIRFEEKVIREESRPFQKINRKTLSDRQLNLNDDSQLENEADREPIRYDEMYEDLYVVLTESDGGKIKEAEERLKKHNIRQKKHEKEEDKNRYLDILRKIHENTDEDEEIEKLKNNIWSRHERKKKRDNSNTIPSELNNREFTINTEPLYLYFAERDGLLADLKTIYSPLPEDESEARKTALKKTESDERIMSFGLKSIKREGKKYYVDTDKGKQLILLLEKYLSLSDGEVEGFEGIEKLKELLKESGLKDFGQIELARRKRVKGNIFPPEDMLIPEEQKVKEKKEKERLGYINGDFLTDLIMTTWSNGITGRDDSGAAKQRLLSHGINVDYEVLQENGVLLKKKLLDLRDHINGTKKMNDEELKAKKLEILSMLGLNVVLEFERKNVSNAEVARENVDDKEKEKYLEYLGGEFLDDLEVVYPRRGVTFTKSVRDAVRERYEDKNKFVKVTFILPKGHKYEGKSSAEYKVRDMLLGYFKLQEGTPANWDVSLLKKMVGGDEERFNQLQVDLEEARKIRLDKVKKTEATNKMRAVESIELSESEIKIIQQRYREMREDQLLDTFDTLIKAGGNEFLWGEWKKRLVGMTGQEKETVLDQLRSTLMLLENTSMRLKYFKYWKDYGSRILGDLKIAI